MHINEKTNIIFNFDRNVNYFTVTLFFLTEQQLFNESVVKCIVTTSNPMSIRMCKIYVKEKDVYTTLQTTLLLELYLKYPISINKCNTFASE